MTLADAVTKYGARAVADLMVTMARHFPDSTHAQREAAALDVLSRKG